jgi:COP9 signalosome complex subunit 4
VQVSDSKRDYTNAAQGYYNLSTVAGLAPEEAHKLFDLGLVCAILAPSGPRKDRNLALILKDERVKVSEHFDLVNKFATGSVIKPSQTKKFEAKLQVHQQIRFSDGYTSLDKALIEHNMRVLSKIYLNITFEELGNFLGISSDQAETIIAKMIGEQRVTGKLDQIN